MPGPILIVIVIVIVIVTERSGIFQIPEKLTTISRHR